MNFVLSQGEEVQANTNYEIFLSLNKVWSKWLYRTGIYATPEQWDANSQRFKSMDDQHDKNARLSELMNRAEIVMNELDETCIFWHYIQFEEKFLSRKPTLKFINFIIYLIAKSITESDIIRLDYCDRIMELLHIYDNDAYERLLCNFDSEYLGGFKEWIKKFKGIAPDERILLLCVLTEIFRLAEREGWLLKSSCN